MGGGREGLKSESSHFLESRFSYFEATFLSDYLFGNVNKKANKSGHVSKTNCSFYIRVYLLSISQIYSA